MKYHGKRYLYNFLKEHGYKVPQMKMFNYKFYRGSEWLKLPFEEIEAYSPVRGVVFVIVKEWNEQQNVQVETEYSKYIDGVLNYQKINGKQTIMFGKPYVKITV